MKWAEQHKEKTTHKHEKKILWIEGKYDLCATRVELEKKVCLELE